MARARDNRSIWTRRGVACAIVLGAALIATGQAAAQPAPTPGSIEDGAVDGRPVDDRGFVDSRARCEGDRLALAVGVTASSLVAICVDRAGGLAYRGVRLSDGAGLALPATPVDGGFVAENDGVEYLVSAAELVVRYGGTVLRREPMRAYRQPRLAAEAGAAEAVPAPPSG